MKRNSTAIMETLDKAKLCLRIVAAHKAVDPVLLQVGELSSVADYFLVAGGRSTRQVQALTRQLETEMRKAGFRAAGVEGAEEGHWVLMDYGDVVIQLFYQPYREFYDLEGLWIDAPRLRPAPEEVPAT